MIIFYSIPILPVVIIVLSVLNAGASWLKDILPVLAGLLILKNLYIDLFYSICRMKHPPVGAVLQFCFGIARMAFFLPILNYFLTTSGGLLGLFDLILSVIFIVPFLSILWLGGELSSLAYGISDQNESIGMTIASNIVSIVCIYLIYLFFNR